MLLRLIILFGVTIGVSMSGVHAQSDLTHEEVNKNITDTLHRYVFYIQCDCRDSLASSGLTGFKMRGENGILTMLHGIPCLQQSNKEIFGTSGDTKLTVELKIAEYDMKNDICILIPKNEDRNRHLTNSTTGLYRDTFNQNTEAKYSIFRANGRNKSFKDYQVQLARSATHPELDVGKLRDGLGYSQAIEEKMKNSIKLSPSYKNFAPVIPSVTALFGGMSGSPLYYVDSNKIKVIGVLHGGTPPVGSKNEAISLFVQPKYIETKVYQKASPIKNLWGPKILGRLNHLSSSIISISKKEEYFILDKLVLRQNSKRKKRSYCFFNTFRQKMRKCIFSLDVVKESSWTRLRKKNNKKRKRARNSNDPVFPLFSVIDQLAFRNEGLLKAITGSDSSIDTLIASIQPVGHRGKKEREIKDLFKTYKTKLITEINDYRKAYTNAILDLNRSKDTTLDYQTRLYSAQQSSLSLVPLIYALKKRLAKNNGHQKSQVLLRVHDTLCSIQEQSIFSARSIKKLITLKAQNAEEFIKSLVKADRIKDLIMLMDTLNTSEFAPLIPYWSVSTRDSVELKTSRFLEKITHDIQSMKTTEQLSKEIVGAYHYLIAKKSEEYDQFLPTINLDSNLEGERMYLSMTSGRIAEISNSGKLVYPAGTSTDFPLGVSSTEKSQKNAIASAQFIADFLKEISSILYPDKDHIYIQKQRHAIIVSIIGMSDGYTYNGYYKEKKEYHQNKGHKKLSVDKFQTVNIIEEINCLESGPEKIIRKQNTLENISLKNWKCVSKKRGESCEPDKTYRNFQSFNSYKNNIRLAYNRALTFSEMIQSELEISGALIANNFIYKPEIWSCNVCQKGGLCRRTEVGIEIDLALFSTSEDMINKYGFRTRSAREKIMHEFLSFINSK